MFTLSLSKFRKLYRACFITWERSGSPWGLKYNNHQVPLFNSYFHILPCAWQKYQALFRNFKPRPSGTLRMFKNLESNYLQGVSESSELHHVWLFDKSITRFGSHKHCSSKIWKFSKHNVFMVIYFMYWVTYFTCVWWPWEGKIRQHWTKYVDKI